ncbi:MAG: hypothetical protein LBQ28_04450 [Prevotellaceae bacterium]|jgi:hypothetical protein|nr:hypothetical protein [Prevotellaceae bacterium]
MSTDFIPKADNQFLVWLKTLIAYLQTKFAEWGVPQTDVRDLETLASEFEDALGIAENPSTRTVVTIQAKNDARHAAESKTRVVLKAYVTYNPAVSNADRDAMGLPIHKTTRTPAPVPTDVPEAEIVLPSPAVVEIHFRSAESSHKAKPDGVHGAEFAWAILDTPPVDWKQLIHSAFDTHTPLRLTFEGSERGKTLYYALRWENTRGEKGPWSEIFSAIIP